MAITYTPTTNFGAKDSLPTNDPDKVIKGSEFTTEFTAIQTAFSLAAPVASPTFTGTVTIPTADINGGNIDGTVIGAATPAAGSFTTGSFTGLVGIGTTSPAYSLTVQQAIDTYAFNIRDTIGNERILIGSRATAPIDNITPVQIANDNAGNLLLSSRTNIASGIKFYASSGTTASEAMRIDSSGNLLVGRTSVGTSGTGHSIRGGDSAVFARENGEVMIVSRNSSDGEIVRFDGNGTPGVGSIGAYTGTTYIQGNASSSGFLFGNNNIYPWDAGALNDAGIDLGGSSNRFKDLYLSGGAYLGGTGAANKLDDYEEGTWTPIFAAASGAAIFNQSPNINMARYTKIGDTVTASFYITYPSTLTTTASYSASSGLQLAGLPFLSNRTGSNDFYASTVGWYDNFTGYSGGSPMIYTNQNQTQCTLVHADGNNISLILQSNVNNGGSAMIATLIYKTTA